MEEEKSKEEIAKELREKAKARKIAVFVVVGFIVIFFIVLFSVKYVYKEKSPYETLTYNNFEFTKIADTWYAQWKHENRLIALALRYSPPEVENVTVLGELGEGFTKSKVYITFDPYSEQDAFKYLAVASAELSQSIVKAFNKEIIPACTRYENETCENLSIVTCDDTDKAVIHIKAEEPTQIILEDNCITLQGKEFELLRAVDKLLYLWYKII
jgi:hypothetical protein